MRRIKTLLSIFTAVILLGGLVVSQHYQVAADTANVPSLVISQLKITSSNGQFVTLYNTTNTALDMSKYQLQYFNSYDLAKATSSKLISLSGTVPPHSYYIVNDSALLLCYQLTVDSVSLGLSSTAGMVEVLAFNQLAPGGSVASSLQDYVGWSKTSASGAQTLPSNTNAFLQRQPVDTQNNPKVPVPGSGTWQAVQPDLNNPCSLVTASGIPSSVTTGLSQLLPPNEPPATIFISGTDIVDRSGQGLPASDIGLMAPQITELLPNPLGTGNDAKEEYIEIYNANAVDFDLSGFGLQSGTTSLHTFTFPNQTFLRPHSFTAFYPNVTGLSLSNSGGQVKLLDPLGNSIAASEPYSTAKDGQAWALAKGKWYWTTTTTPNTENIIKTPPVTKKTSAASKQPKKTSAGKVKGVKTKKTSLAVAATTTTDPPIITPIHKKVFALVGGIALLYGIYEYRRDMANRFHQFRRYLTSRRAGRS